MCIVHVAEAEELRFIAAIGQALHNQTTPL